MIGELVPDAYYRFVFENRICDGRMIKPTSGGWFITDASWLLSDGRDWTRPSDCFVSNQYLCGIQRITKEEMRKI